jgi:sialate O-acetylesterase
MKFSVVVFLLACLFLSAKAQLKPARLFGDHMVLQRNQDVPVWGWADKKAKVTIAFNGQVVSAKADEQGYWKAILKPMEAGGPYVMKISSGKENIELSDVMLGEVWLCSGQSNMELVLKNVLGYKYEQREAASLPIRQFHVPDKISLEPEKDLSGGDWIKADTNTVGDFTAAGYFFAKKLAQTLHVTIGLVHTSWGGTQVESWISKEAMLKSPELGAVAKTLPNNWDELKARVDRQLKEYAYRNGPVVNYTADQLASQPASFFETWQKGSAPGPWIWMGKLYSYAGEGFMQKTIKLDSSYAKNSSTLQLGNTDADLVMYVNGKIVQNGALSNNFQVSLPPGTWKGGDNSLLIDLQSRQKSPSRYGMGLNSTGNNDLFVKFSDTTVNLADGNWHTMPDLSKPYHFDYLPNNSAFTLYNSMINPLIPYSIAGAIWYQGETNVDRSYQYRTSFPLMINDWRNRWGKPFPFLFVQLASFGTFQNSNVGSGWAELREAQNLTLQLPNTGIALTTDISEAINIHPRDKADVGFRLASKALSMVYHLPGFGESPMYRSADFKEGSAIVSFDHAENGLMAKDKYGYLRGFELAGADHKFYYARAVIVDGNKVKVWCPDVTQPVAVRYAWTDAPVDANLFNKEGFPVSQFRSDDWKGITEGKGFE